MAKKVPVIKIPRGKADEICRALKIGRTTLYAALNGTSDSANAKRTREVVLAKYGGVKDSRILWNQ